MKNKPKVDNKWGNKKTRKVSSKISYNDDFSNKVSKLLSIDTVVTKKGGKTIVTNSIDVTRLRELITQTQQETLEWVLKQIGDGYEQGVTTVQFKDGTGLIFTCQESLHDVNSFIRHLKQTIKKKMGDI